MATPFRKVYTYPDWYNEKIYVFYQKKLQQLYRLRYEHREAASYFAKLHLKIYAPSIVITGLSGVASFLASSSLIEGDAKTGLTIGVGVFTSIATMIQSFASAVDYSTKSKMHREASEEYDKLITSVEFEMEMPNEEDFLDKLETNILDIQNKCKYPPPRHIQESYSEKKDKLYMLRKASSTDLRNAVPQETTSLLEHVVVDTVASSRTCSPSPVTKKVKGSRFTDINV